MGSRKPKPKNKSKSASTHPAATATVADKLPAAGEFKPVPVSDEMPEDAAVFNGQILRGLPESLRSECEAVKSSLELAEKGQDDAALALLQNIPRQSPYADWRLFLRGLSDFYQLDYEEARQAWSRLTPSRRPARIACALLDSVGQPRADTLAAVTIHPDSLPIARQTLDRTSIVQAAQKILAAKHPSTAFSLAQAAMLRSFAERYRALDPAFAIRFMQSCVHLSIKQEGNTVFSQIRSFVPGPAYDPGWRLVDLVRSFDTLNDGEDKYAWLQNYFTCNLDPNPHLTASAKNALKSQLLLMLTKSFHEFEIGPPDVNLHAQALQESILFCPTNRQAHEDYVELLEDQIDDDDDDRDEVEKLELRERRIEALLKYAEAFPNDGDIARQLAEAYMEIGQLNQATREAERAIKLRDDSPKIKSLHWQIKLQQAMQSARLKANLPQISAMTEEAIALWPTWLSRDWIPFLQAAARLRMGDVGGSEQLRQEGIAVGKIPALTAALMTYLAYQKFNVPPAQIKRHREELDSCLAKMNKCEAADLAWAASFLWDLGRTDITLKGMSQREFRLGQYITTHVAKFEFNSPHGQACFCWLSNANFFGALAKPFKDLATTPRQAAAFIDFLMYNDIDIGREPLTEMLDVVVEGLATESDPWYLADMQQTVEATKTSMSLSLADLNSAGASVETLDDFKNYLEMARNMAAQMGVDLNDFKDQFPPGLLDGSFFDNIGAFQDDDDDDWDDEDEDDDDDDGLLDIDGAGGHFSIDDMLGGMPGMHTAHMPEASVPPPKSAEELKAFKKQRQKELERARKRK